MNYFTVFIDFVNSEEVVLRNRGKPLTPQERFLISYIANFPAKSGFVGSITNLKFVARKNRKSLLKTLKKMVDIGILEKSDIPHFRTKKYRLTSELQTLYNKVKKKKDRYFYVRLDFLDGVEGIDLTDMLLISYIASFPDGYGGLQRDLIEVLGISRPTLSKKLKKELFIIENNQLWIEKNLQTKLYIMSLQN